MSGVIRGVIRIVIGQRGWVWVGRVSRSDHEVLIEGARVIRRWGATRGLAQLVSGPTPETVLDDPATLRLHPLQIVGQYDADQAAWEGVLRG